MIEDETNSMKKVTIKIEEENQVAEVIELNDFDPLSPYADAKPDIQFHISPRNMDELQFIDKLNQSQQK